MKKFSLFAMIGAFFLIACSFSGREQYETLKIGASAPMQDYEMITPDGEAHSIKSLAKSNGTLIIFSCNTCPFVRAWENRYPQIYDLAEEVNIGFALINSNTLNRDGDDSPEAMSKHAAEQGYSNIPYVVDENSKLANAFGAKTTPHVFLFDSEMKLVYEGAIDDNFKDATAVEANYLEDAMNSLLNGSPIDPQTTKAIGCSIKRPKE